SSAAAAATGCCPPSSRSDPGNAAALPADSRSRRRHRHSRQSLRVISGNAEVPMRIPLYQVDAFTSRLFGGNPAAVCPLSEWLPEATMQAIAAENNLAETAFFVPQRDHYLLRWFTPTVEVELCGHATLASGYVVTHILAPQRRSATFDTLKAGPLEVTRDGD